jgi:hypothetical protein
MSMMRVGSGGGGGSAAADCTSGEMGSVELTAGGLAGPEASVADTAAGGAAAVGAVVGLDELIVSGGDALAAPVALASAAGVGLAPVAVVAGASAVAAGSALAGESETAKAKVAAKMKETLIGTLQHVLGRMTKGLLHCCFMPIA